MSAWLAPLCATCFLALVAWCVAWGPAWTWVVTGGLALLGTVLVAWRLLRAHGRAPSWQLGLLWLASAGLTPLSVRAGNHWFYSHAEAELASYEAIARSLLARPGNQQQLQREPAPHVALAIAETDRNGARRVVFAFDGPGRRRLCYAPSGPPSVSPGDCPFALRPHWYWLARCGARIHGW